MGTRQCRCKMTTKGNGRTISGRRKITPEKKNSKGLFSDNFTYVGKYAITACHRCRALTLLDLISSLPCLFIEAKWK